MILYKTRVLRALVLIINNNFSLIMSNNQLINCFIGEHCVKRFIVPNHLKSWHIVWDQYKPQSFTIDFTSKSWADPSLHDTNFKPKWNQLDGNVDRTSFVTQYQISSNGYPLNPMGRTGISLRGVLGRWGPNHAADPIVTRWKRNAQNEIIRHVETNLPILQFVSIKRKDTNEWAIPGGMVDCGEHVSSTLKREFFEEALNILECDQNQRNQLENKLKEFFSTGKEIYRGYVDDPRNTDNAWMETIAINFHDETGSTMGDIELTAGDDADGVKWTDIDNNIELYANHKQFIIKTAKLLKAI